MTRVLVNKACSKSELIPQGIPSNNFQEAPRRNICRSSTAHGIGSSFAHRLLASLLLLTFCCNSLQAQDTESKLADSIAAFDKKIEVAEQAFRDQVAAAKKEHIDALKSLRTEATSNDNLNLALKIRERSDAISNEVTLPEQKSTRLAERARLSNALSRSTWLTENTNWKTKTSVYFDPNGVRYDWGDRVDISDPKLSCWAAVGPRTIVLKTDRHIDVIEFNRSYSEFQKFYVGEVPNEPDPEFASIKRKLVDPPKK